MSAAKTKNTTINQLTLSGRKKRRTLNGHLIMCFDDQLLLCLWLSVGYDDVAVVMVLRCAKKEGKSTVVQGDFSEICRWYYLHT